jgi:hypothetical protein
VARSVIDYYDRTGARLDGARVLLEGFGNVGAAAGLYLARAGARLVAISDAEKALVAPDGMDAAEVERLIREGPDRLLPQDPRCRAGDGRDASSACRPRSSCAPPPPAPSTRSGSTS